MALKILAFGQREVVGIGGVPPIYLQEAREAKLEAKKLIIGGIDPVAHKRNNKDEAVRNVKNTFQAIALEWYESRKDIWKPRYADEVLKRLEDDIFPQIGKMPIKDIEPPTLLKARGFKTYGLSRAHDWSRL